MKNYLLTAGILIKISVYAQSGSLDNAFGTGGKVCTDIALGSDIGNAVVLQNDGKIIVAGASDFSLSSLPENDFAVVRYNTDGTLDNSFDFDGKVTTDFGSTTAVGKAIALQSDGKIVVAGFSYNGSDNDVAIARYNSDGSLDNSFDLDGKVISDFGTSDEIFSVAIQSDGKIVVAGVSYNVAANQVFSAYRYNSNGSLDASFGTGGKATTAFSTNFDVSYCLAIQDDGKILLGGYSYDGFNTSFALLRYNSNGTLDNSFDSDGKTTTDFGSSDAIGRSIVIQGDGKIIVTGYNTSGANTDFALARYNNNGTLDTSFDLDGKVTTDFGGNTDACFSVALQNDNKIVVVGNSMGSTSDYDFALARYNGDGSLDNTFDSDGKVITVLGNNADYAYSLAIQNDDKIVVAGMSFNGSFYDFAITRYNNTVTLGVDSDSYSNENITIYPNPSTGIFNIKNKSVEARVCIYDVLGNCIQRKDCHELYTTIDLSRQPKGIYFMETLSGEVKTVTKIILH